MRSVLLFIFIIFSISACDGTGSTTGNQSELSACIERGISYYREIGSYPTLSSPPNTGRLAEEVVAERCRRTTTAF